MDHAMERLSPPCQDTTRCRWLIAATVTGGMGSIATIVPFAESFAPSEKARAEGAPASVDLGRLARGEMMAVAWRGTPVFVVNRTDEMMAGVLMANTTVADPTSKRPFSMPLPTYCDNPYRFRQSHPNMLVVVGVCTHLGCTPSPRFQKGPEPNLPDNWPGGFQCPCHGSTYDLTDRVFRDKPAPQNLDLPRFQFVSPLLLSIGRDQHGEA